MAVSVRSSILRASAVVRQVERAARAHRVDETDQHGPPIVVHEIFERLVRDVVLEERAIVRVQHVLLDAPPDLRRDALAHVVAHVERALATHADLPVQHDDLAIVAEEQVVEAKIAVDHGPRPSAVFRQFSAAFTKVVPAARTIADLVRAPHVAEAVQARIVDRELMA
jgi:hypothetical protein